MREAYKNLKSIKAITGSSLLSALNVVFHYTFTTFISTVNHISLGFITLGLCGYFYGPFLAGIAGVIADIVGFLMKNDGGIFFIGFTFNNFLSGFLYGLFLFKKKLNFQRILLASIVVNVVISMGFTPLWLSVLYGKGYFFYLAQRVVKVLITIPIETTVLYILAKKLSEIKLIQREILYVKSTDK